MLPKLGRAALDPGPLADARPQKWFSKPTTLEQADAHRREAIDAYAARYELNDTSSVGELLEVAREFAWDPKVAEIMADLIVAERIGKRLAGRPRGHSRHVLQRMLRIGRVVEGLRDSGLTREEIFEAMDKQHFESVSKGRQIRDYDEARRHPALQSQLFTREDQRRIVRGDDSGTQEWSFHLQQVRVECPVALPTGLRPRIRWKRSAAGLAFDISFH
jgi:hypothetical protein